MLYNVEVKEVTVYNISVEAETKEEAERKAERTMNLHTREELDELIVQLYYEDIEAKEWKIGK